MGRNDQDAPRTHRQLHQEPLELHHEEEERRTHGHPRRYLLPHADLIHKKKTAYISKAEAGEHYVKIEHELLAAIYENKENVIKIKDKNIQAKSGELDKRKVAVLEESCDNHLTAVQNRAIEHQQFNSKSTEKFVENDSRMPPFSSVKKSERSLLKENCSSLIFDTPPKGKGDKHGFYKFNSSKFFMERIEYSPTPLKVEEAERQEEVIVLLSPAKFMFASDRKEPSS